MSHVLLIASGFIHPPLGGILTLKRFLGDLRYIKLTHETKLSEESADLLAAYDAVILYFSKPEHILSEKIEKSLIKYLNRGGGILALHSTTGSFNSSDAYYSILGGRLIETRPADRLSIIPHPAAEKSFSDFPQFTIRDELCIHEFRDDVHVQMTTDSENGKVPVVWTRRQGSGRVCCISAGHRASTFNSFEIRRLVSSAINYLL